MAHDHAVPVAQYLGAIDTELVNIILVDIAEDIDFIYITEDIGIIGGGNGFNPVRFSIRSTAPKSRPLTRRLVERTASGSPYAPGGK